MLVAVEPLALVFREGSLTGYAHESVGLAIKRLTGNNVANVPHQIDESVGFQSRLLQIDSGCSVDGSLHSTFTPPHIPNRSRRAIWSEPLCHARWQRRDPAEGPRSQRTLLQHKAATVSSLARFTNATSSSAARRGPRHAPAAAPRQQRAASGPLLVCSTCHRRAYCSAACQRKDWN